MLQWVATLLLAKPREGGLQINHVGKTRHGLSTPGTASVESSIGECDLPDVSDGVMAWCDGLQTVLTGGGWIGDGGCWGDRCDRSRAAACLQQLAMQLPNREQHIQGYFAYFCQVAAQEAHPKPLNAS